MIKDKDGWHIEARDQGRWARLIGQPITINWFPIGWLFDSFNVGWYEIDQDSNAPKAEISI